MKLRELEHIGLGLSHGRQEETWKSEENIHQQFL